MIAQEEKGIIFVFGVRRKEFLGSLVTNDLSKEITHAAFLTRFGKVIALCTFYALSHADIIVTEKVCLTKLLEILSLAKLMNCTIVNKTQDFFFYTFYGEQREALVHQLFGRTAETITEINGAIIAHHGTQIDIFSPKQLSVPLLSAEEKEFIRIEQGIPAWGKEIDEKTAFTDLGLTYAVSYTKGCYVGQEVVARVKHLGQPPQLLRKVIIDGQMEFQFRAPMTRDEKTIGFITSAAVQGEKTIALGFVQKGHYSPCTNVFVLGQQAVLAEIPSHCEKENI